MAQGEIATGQDNSGMVRLISQYLAGAGADIGAGGAIGSNVNQITQQNIQSQSFMKLLQKMLGSDGKVTMDNKGAKFDLPKSMLSPLFQGTQPGGIFEGLAPPLGAKGAVDGMSGSQSGTVNPFLLASQA